MNGGNPLKRRRFLKLGIGGAILVAVSGGVFKWVATGYSGQLSPGEVPMALSVKELAVVKAVVRAMLPAVDGFPSGESLGVVQRIDEEVWSTTEATRNDFKNGLQLLEHATVAYGFGSRFTSLGAAERRAYLDKLLTGGGNALRQVASGLKQMVHLFYYAHPDVWKVIGYEGPMVPEAVPPDSHVAYRNLLKRGGST